ncbi:hypothetical protein BBO_06047 [Beauveria brongniartii RCEF 3172]|uniref:Uncharacterized protein n=1 Tax=Beauveria brongniartii RCEF 3172 TaxID=1081107 RepID=A0A162JD05_9HYPO|nr:hypothetical protein BBO_06047 [Beauveria brongniartii RCEF 3172]
MPPFKFCVIVGALATALARATGGQAQVVLSTDESPVQHPLVPVDRKTLEKARQCFDDCFIRTVTVKPTADVILVQVFEQDASPDDSDDSDDDAALHSVVGLVGDEKHRKYYNRLKAQYDAVMRSKEGEHAKDDPCD